MSCLSNEMKVKMRMKMKMNRGFSKSQGTSDDAAT